MLDGHPAPMSLDEYTDWVALRNIEARERKREQDRQGRPRRGRRR